jgi:hypothetical protein
MVFVLWLRVFYDTNFLGFWKIQVALAHLVIPNATTPQKRTLVALKR